VRRSTFIIDETVARTGGTPFFKHTAIAAAGGDVSDTQSSIPATTTEVHAPASAIAAALGVAPPAPAATFIHTDLLRCVPFAVPYLGAHAMEVLRRCQLHKWGHADPPPQLDADAFVVFRADLRWHRLPRRYVAEALTGCGAAANSNDNETTHTTTDQTTDQTNTLPQQEEDGKQREEEAFITPPLIDEAVLIAHGLVPTAEGVAARQSLLLSLPVEAYNLSQLEPDPDHPLHQAAMPTPTVSKTTDDNNDGASAAPSAGGTDGSNTTTVWLDPHSNPLLPPWVRDAIAVFGRDPAWAALLALTPLDFRPTLAGENNNPPPQWGGGSPTGANDPVGCAGASDDGSEEGAVDDDGIEPDTGDVGLQF
jgi:hypothetical protein